MRNIDRQIGIEYSRYVFIDQELRKTNSLLTQLKRKLPFPCPEKDLPEPKLLQEQLKNSRAAVTDLVKQRPGTYCPLHRLTYFSPTERIGTNIPTFMYGFRYPIGDTQFYVRFASDGLNLRHTTDNTPTVEIDEKLEPVIHIPRRSYINITSVLPDPFSGKPPILAHAAWTPMIRYLPRAVTIPLDAAVPWRPTYESRQTFKDTEELSKVEYFSFK